MAYTTSGTFPKTVAVFTLFPVFAVVPVAAAVFDGFALGYELGVAIDGGAAFAELILGLFECDGATDEFLDDVGFVIPI